tara:strand:- start:85 stop:309 length:225 start_codon:yes stop_codon:yes gene_type:complete
VSIVQSAVAASFATEGTRVFATVTMKDGLITKVRWIRYQIKHLFRGVSAVSCRSEVQIDRRSSSSLNQCETDES